MKLEAQVTRTLSAIFPKDQLLNFKNALVLEMWMLRRQDILLILSLDTNEQIVRILKTWDVRIGADQINQ